MAEVLLLVDNLSGARVLAVKFDCSIDVSVIHAWTLNITVETAVERWLHVFCFFLPLCCYLLDKLIMKGDLRCHPLSATFLEGKNVFIIKRKLRVAVSK